MVKDPAWFRGKRALILTRVSSETQAKKYGHSAQERGVRQQLIAELGMYVIGVIRDTYTGLEYQYREALDRILRMAENGEFDVLCMDVLDRGLGRKAIARELYRMQLRDFGIRILTTDESDHADDDTFEGLRARLHKGLKAEEEILDLKRRTRNGRMQKALGDPEQGIPPRVIGSGPRRYGYKYIHNKRGTRIGYELNYDVVHVAPDGTEWTEVMVVRFIFAQAADGVSTHQLAVILQSKGIPTPFQSKGAHTSRMKDEQVWQPQTVRRLIQDSGYYGEHHANQTVATYLPGRKRPVQKKVPKEQHIIVPIPAIVTKEEWEKANRHIAVNKKVALRNNKFSKECLLRGGFARCAYCGQAAYPVPKDSGKSATYDCAQPYLKTGKCPGCCISVDTIDNAVKAYIREVIRDPSEVDKMIAELLKENPLDKLQQKKAKDLNKILQDQKQLRANLAREMKKKVLSEQTVAILGAELASLEKQEQDARADLANQQKVQEQQQELELRIAQFHQQCQEWREKLDDPQFSPDFHFYQEALLFFGIHVTLWKAGTKPRWDIYTRPPEIVELIS
jgi:site-specific DNA recombinase